MIGVSIYSREVLGLSNIPHAMAPANVQIIHADLNDPAHQEAVKAMTNAYALDPMGNGKPLPEEVLARLLPGLKAHPTTMVLLASVNGSVVGIATCFVGFSTFAAQTLINIHDLAVLPEHRGRGIGRALLTAVEAKARALNCVKVTLEVQENNQRARHTYKSFGFAQAVYGDETGGSLFYTKVL